ncbi:MAG TPA: amidohydrolase family protein, partial [Dehalococcoidia bacterium]|nr:amidohydrolase family protein [Dehalococcoidia bacterium]
DVHIHLCRDTAQEKAVFPKKGWPDEWYWCSPDKVGPYMDARRVSHIVAVNIMDTGRMTDVRLARLPADISGGEREGARAEIRTEMQERVRSFNDWICATFRENARIIPFVMMDPVLFGPGLADELERCIQMGAQGVKIHPSICGHMPDDPCLMPVYERCQEAGLGVLSDTGTLVNPDGQMYGLPLHWVPVLSSFPSLKFIMAHLCDSIWDDRIDLAREFKENLWFDTAGGLLDDNHPPAIHRGMMTSQAPRVFRKIGVERIMFGTDAPGRGDVDIRDRAAQITALSLSDDEKEMILSRNARQFLGL